MAKIVIDQTRCVLCGACENACPFGAITAAGTVVSIGENCVFCSACREVCPVGAIRILEQKNDTAAVPQEKGILVYGQLAGGRLLGAAREMVGAAQRLALPGEGISLVCMGEID